MRREPSCPFCLALVGEEDNVCPSCNRPIGMMATLDPMLTVRSEGELFRRSVRRPSLLTLLGVWLVFGPAVLVPLWLVMETNMPIPQAVLAGGYFLVGAAIVYKVTANYLRRT